MKEDLGLNSFLKGYQAALHKEQLKDTDDEQFVAGYKAGEEELATKNDNALEFYKRHPDLFEIDYQKNKETKEKSDING